MSSSIEVRVAEAETLNPLIRRLRLQAPAGQALPAFSAGAHVRVWVSLPGNQQDWRHYSLINPLPQASATSAPTHYDIAVRREDEGRGESWAFFGRVGHERGFAAQEIAAPDRNARRDSKANGHGRAVW